LKIHGCCIFWELALFVSEVICGLEMSYNPAVGKDTVLYILTMHLAGFSNIQITPHWLAESLPHFVWKNHHQGLINDPGGLDEEILGGNWINLIDYRIERWCGKKKLIKMTIHGEANDTIDFNLFISWTLSNLIMVVLQERVRSEKKFSQMKNSISVIIPIWLIFYCFFFHFSGFYELMQVPAIMLVLEAKL